MLSPFSSRNDDIDGEIDDRVLEPAYANSRMAERERGRGGKRREENETKTDWQGGEGWRKNGTWCSINGIYIHATGRDGVLGGKKREGGGRGRGREGGTVRYSITSFRSISKVN